MFIYSEYSGLIQGRFKGVQEQMFQLFLIGYYVNKIDHQYCKSQKNK